VGHPVSLSLCSLSLSCVPVWRCEMDTSLDSLWRPRRR
jgi:hypothetical protein